MVLLKSVHNGNIRIITNKAIKSLNISKKLDIDVRGKDKI